MGTSLVLLPELWRLCGSYCGPLEVPDKISVAVLDEVAGLFEHTVAWRCTERTAMCTRGKLAELRWLDERAAFEHDPEDATVAFREACASGNLTTAQWVASRYAITAETKDENGEL